MKKSLIVIPSSLFILSMYAGTPEIRAATEGSTEIETSNPADAILYEYPLGITIPATVITETLPAEAVAPTTPVTETPPAEAVAPTTPVTETPPAEAVAPTTPVTETLPAEAVAPTTPVTETLPAEAVAPTTPVTETLPAEAVAPTTPVTETPPAEAVAPTTPVTETLPAEAVAPTTPVTETLPAEAVAPTTPVTETLPAEAVAPTTPVTETPIVEIIEKDTVTEIPVDETIASSAIEAPLVSENSFVASSSKAVAAPATMAYAFSESTGPSQLISSVEIDDKVIALTFDDGHADTNLYDILANLKSLGVKATFFMNGDADPALLKQIVDDGHQLANHSYSHGYSTTLSPDALTNDINLMEDYIQDSTGTSSIPFFRAPYGDVNASVLDTVGSLGYQYTIGWSTDTLDWTGISDVAVSNAVVNNIHPGSIVLMHASVGAANTPESLWYSIPSLQNAGYSFATVSDLLSMGGYYSAITEENPVVVAPVVEDYSDDILSQVVNQVNTNKKTVSLTISDASDAATVRQILANLATTDVKATFFLNGLTDPDVINEIVSQGHEIGNNTYTQADATAITVDELVWEVNALETLVQDSTGEATSRPYFRAPMGLTNDAILATVASMGYEYTIGWNNMTQDWAGTQTADQISTSVVNNLSPGSILLFHGNSAAVNTPEALLKTITAARNLGYSFATISGLLALEGDYSGNTDIPVTENPIEAKPIEEPIAEILASTSPSKLLNQIGTDQKVVSLTISGVSDDTRLDAILKNLASLGIKATFFVEGSSSQAALKKIVAAGHEIGNQAYSGAEVTGMTAQQLISEVSITETAIENAGATIKPYFRAPGGLTDTSVLTTVGSMGYEYTIGWSIDPRDWSGISANEITSIVTSQLAPGAIILLDAGTTATGTAASLLTTIAQAKALGYQFTTISGLLGWEGVYTGVTTTPPKPVVPVVVEEESGPSRYVTHVDTNQNVLALTFDDGDDYGNLYDIVFNLNSLGIKATFFLNGSTDPVLMKFIVDSGHQLANHTYSHNDDSTALSASALSADINLMEDYILETTGVSSKPYFRAPAGVLDNSVLETVGSLGYGYTIGWTQDTRDWEGLSDVAIAASVTDSLDAGSIYLLHANPTATGTPESLWYMVAEARSQGYDFVTIDQLMKLENGYDGTTGVIIADPNGTASQFIEQVETDKKVISLTFDDMGDTVVLQQILDTLADLGVKATFFADASVDPNMLDKVVAQGHEIGNHTYSHEFSTYLTTQEFANELNSMDSIIQAATGISSRPLFRPPYGDYDTSVLETAGSLGYDHTIGWSIDSLDWEGTHSPSEIAANVLDNIVPGAIVLMHAVPESANTPASLFEIISSARALGYEFATISDLLALEGSYTSSPIVDPPTATTSQVINQVSTSEKVVSLTISGVSDAARLDAILNNLDSLGIKATFFVEGSASQAALKKIVAAGHEIGNQAYSGAEVTGMTAQQLTSELAITKAAIQTAGATVTPYFRAPGGATNASMLTTVGGLGYDYTIGWSIDPRDWSGISANEITSLVTSKLAPGAIILLDAGTSATGTAASLLTTIAQAKALGYQFATISNLLALEGIHPNPIDPTTPVDPVDPSYPYGTCQFSSFTSNQSSQH